MDFGKNKENVPIEKNKFNINKIKNSKKILPITLFVVTIIILSTIFAILNITNNKIIKGIKINGIDVSDLTKEEAMKKIEKLINDNIKADIVLKYENLEYYINLNQIDTKYKLEDALDIALKKGKSGNIIKDNLDILKCKFNNYNIVINYEYNNNKLLNEITSINEKLPEVTKEPSYYIEDTKLILTRGKDGIIIKEDSIKNKIIEIINDFNKEKSIKILVENKKPNEIDIEKIYKEIYREPKDAYYTKDPFKLYPHIDGIDFNISIDQVKEMLKEEKEEYSIPLKITKPNITTDKLSSEAFPDLLSSFTTKYDASNADRSNNLLLASNKINSTVVMPGETFSYNKIVGERTIAAGYKEAKVYANGKVVDGIGGGICQISSTLYNAVIYANLEVISRQNHQFVTSYVGVGRDATVVYGAIDFKFKNTRKYPVKIKSTVKNGIAKMEIYGIKEEVEYIVDIKTDIINNIPYTIEYNEDSSIEKDKEIVTQKGTSGYKSETYKTLKLNGETISKDLISKDSYNSMPRIITKGTKVTENINKTEEIQTNSNMASNTIENYNIQQNTNLN